MLSDEELTKWKEICTDATEDYSSKVTDWEISFCAYTLARLEQYGAKTIMSEKQEEVLKKIEEKIYAT